MDAVDSNTRLNSNFNHNFSDYFQVLQFIILQFVSYAVKF